MATLLTSLANWPCQRWSPVASERRRGTFYEPAHQFPEQVCAEVTKAPTAIAHALASAPASPLWLGLPDRRRSLTLNQTAGRKKNCLTGRNIPIYLINSVDGWPPRPQMKVTSDSLDSCTIKSSATSLPAFGCPRTGGNGAGFLNGSGRSMHASACRNTS